MGDTGAVADGTESVDDGGEGAKDVGDVLAAHGVAGERGVLLAHELEEGGQGGVGPDDTGPTLMRWGRIADARRKGGSSI